MIDNTNWGDIINEAEAERFVGREKELDAFRREISLLRPRFLIFYIAGQGGVGKTTLLNRYREIAKDFGLLLTGCAEQQRDVLTVLGRYSRQLDEQGFPLKHFEERYKAYLQKIKEIETDPNAPQGLAAMLSRTVVRAFYLSGDLVPGLRKGLEFIPRESVENQAIEWASYLAKKLTNKDEVSLVQDPVPILTSLFFEDLNEVAQKKRVLLSFDNFEATRKGLQEWLLELPEHKPSQNIRIAIAGRDQPGSNWDPLRRVTMIVHLDVFTEREAEAFLDLYSITNVKRRQEILECSGRLPVLMSWLAASEGEEPDPSIPTYDIVERFLRWVNEPTLRQVGLLAAIPLVFDIDILTLLLKNDGHDIDVQNAFDWLLAMPFVQQRSDGWHYHDVVRRMMVQYQRQKAPHTYRQMHTILADFFAAKRYELGCSDEERWTNDQWRKVAISYLYHFLIADPSKHWREVMGIFAVARHKNRHFAIEIMELLNADDIHRELSHERNNIVLFFRQLLQDIENGNLQEDFDMFDRLCDIPGLSTEQAVQAAQALPKIRFRGLTGQQLVISILLELVQRPDLSGEKAIQLAQVLPILSSWELTGQQEPSQMLLILMQRSDFSTEQAVQLAQVLPKICTQRSTDHWKVSQVLLELLWRPDLSVENADLIYHVLYEVSPSGTAAQWWASDKRWEQNVPSMVLEERSERNL